MEAAETERYHAEKTITGQFNILPIILYPFWYFLGVFCFDSFCSLLLVCLILYCLLLFTLNLIL